MTSERERVERYEERSRGLFNLAALAFAILGFLVLTLVGEPSHTDVVVLSVVALTAALAYLALVVHLFAKMTLDVLRNGRRREGSR